ncbi:hypothetical protein I551_7775 [Mycobacterium ulcerans str. Harvey]|uniref:Uncharacterized protein n=1 Tax=Mycobacterium ulcerans str. Harvey TaxID=1299332 RepID=A0ABP3A2F8_MYCUL|nr:hypothetical protein I551_7775 [Mycobacterium ulcerans str. Harvey]
MSARSRSLGPLGSGTPWRRFAAAAGPVLSGPGGRHDLAYQPAGLRPVAARFSRCAPDTAHCEAWGSGAEEFIDQLPALLGADDDAADFVPRDPTVAAAHRRLPNLRLGRTGQVLEAVLPAVIEQRVPGAEAFRSWRLLVTRYGTRPRSGAGRDAGAAVGGCMAGHSVLGVSPRQRRSRAGTDGRGLRAAGVGTATACHAARGGGPGRADELARRRGVDCRRDRATRVR